MSVAEKGSTAATIWPVSVLIATFLSNPSQGEISRCAAYVRNNGLLGKRPSFTIMSSRCRHVGCPTEPNVPVFAQRHRLERTSTGEVGVGHRGALDRYQFSIRNGRIWLGDIYSVSRVQGAGAQARTDSHKRLGDGEPASGPESLLYPVDPIS